MQFQELYSVIFVAFENLEYSINKETAEKSSQLLSAIRDAKFIIPLVIINKIFAYILTLYKQLQTVNADLVEACDHVDNILLILDEIREDNKNQFSDMFLIAAKMLNKEKH